VFDYDSVIRIRKKIVFCLKANGKGCVDHPWCEEMRSKWQKEGVWPRIMAGEWLAGERLPRASAEKHVRSLVDRATRSQSKLDKGW
jgi:hypothetical protein